MTKAKKAAFKAFVIENLIAMNEEPNEENIKNSFLDINSMELLKETEYAYIILYSEGMGGAGSFVDVIYKYDKRMQTIEL